MTQHASGKFDVNLKPAGGNDKSGRTETGRMLIDKQYHGPFVATGKGEMLTAVTETKGSAAYVAIERVTGTLNGKQGSFVVQHAGTMNGGKQRLSIEIVPDSGTEALSGIAGTMNIKIVDRQHYYEIDYTLP